MRSSDNLPPRDGEENSASGEPGLIFGAGEMAALIRAHAWDQTPLGPVDTWSPALLSTVNLLLSSPFPTALFAGPELTLLYNDSYRPFTSTKHPGSLGCPGAEVWSEAWHLLGPLYEAAHQRGETSYQENVLIPLYENGVLRDFFWINSISPLWENGRIIGVYNVCQNMTESVLRAQQLRASEARATRILASIGDAVIVTDAETRVTRMNKVAETLTGWKESEAYGQLLSDVFHIVSEATREQTESPADKVRRLGTTVALANHTILIARDGTERNIDDSGAPIRDDEGELTGIVLVFRSIDERRSIERERDRLSAQLGQVLGATNDGVLSVDRGWRITYLNPRGRVMTAALGSILGQTIWETWPDIIYDDSPFVEHYHRAMHDRLPGDFEAYCPAPLSAWFQFEVRPSEDGMVIFFRDTSDERQAAEDLRATAKALAESEKELRWTVDLSAQTPWTASPEGKILDFSEQWLRLTGLTRESVLGDGWAQVPHPLDLPRMQVAWSNALATGAPYDIEHRIRTASGEYRWMRSRAFARFGDSGEIVKWYGTTEDIHERKRAEEALIQSEKLAAVGRLAASIAHEINNPLESVTNLIYLARTAGAIHEVQQYLDLAERELRRVSAISSQTLRFHRQSTSPTRVHAAELMDSILSIYQGRLLNSRISVERRLRASAAVTCFEGEIRQVLSNLIGNAIDALPSAGGRLLLRSRIATEWSTGRTGLVLTIADTGSGMSPGVVKRAFEPFFTTKGIGGTGLGLWISQEILVRHEGLLRVRSRQAPGRHGTVFTLWLPFVAAVRL